jgi:hypothetical protein
LGARRAERESVERDAAHIQHVGGSGFECRLGDHGHRSQRRCAGQAVAVNLQHRTVPDQQRTARVPHLRVGLRGEGDFGPDPGGIANGDGDDRLDHGGRALSTL